MKFTLGQKQRLFISNISTLRTLRQLVLNWLLLLVKSRINGHCNFKNHFLDDGSLSMVRLKHIVDKFFCGFSVGFDENSACVVGGKRFHSHTG